MPTATLFKLSSKFHVDHWLTSTIISLVFSSIGSKKNSKKGADRSQPQLTQAYILGGISCKLWGNRIMTRKEAALNRQKALAEGARQYLGKICSKHPELGGLRMLNGGKCRGCTRARRNSAKFRAKANARRRTPEFRAYRRRTLRKGSILRLKFRMRARINAALRLGGQKKSARTMDLVGCTSQFLKQYLEQQFLPGMTWANHGEWHIDHIRPLNTFDLSNLSQQHLAFHYTNLRPLWSVDNLHRPRDGSDVRGRLIASSGRGEQL